MANFSNEDAVFAKKQPVFCHFGEKASSFIQKLHKNVTFFHHSEFIREMTAT